MFVPCLAALAILPAGISRAASIAVNFHHADYLANTGIQSEETAMGIPGSSWTNLAIAGAGGTASGTGSAGGLTIVWNSANAWNAGSEGVLGTDASQQVFRMYLDDGDGGSSFFNGDGYGASVQISGLAAFLGTNGAANYSLTLYFSTDSTSFTTADVRQGLLGGTPSATSISSLSLLGNIAPQQPLGDGTYPIPSGAQTETSGHRGIGTLNGLTADSITVAMPVNAGNGVRGSLAGFSVTAVPEPSVSLMLGALSLAGLLRRRR
ncbi:MAG: proteinsorting protein [Verrucomicrobiales bacterium]|nr:proteinsorting protein [Verrucomicrobiales bacterium]